MSFSLIHWVDSHEKKELWVDGWCGFSKQQDQNFYTMENNSDSKFRISMPSVGSKSYKKYWCQKSFSVQLKIRQYSRAWLLENTKKLRLFYFHWGKDTSSCIFGKSPNPLDMDTSLQSCFPKSRQKAYVSKHSDRCMA